jgi:low temperature requirement protein LtrA
MASTALPWKLPLAGRDPEEEHRASTPLELLFDLSFVVAVAAAAAALHHDLSAGHFSGLVGYSMMFFGIWWAWLNYSWFASAYDTGDVVFRLTTFAILTGVLLLAAGVPNVFKDKPDFTIVVVGYLIMRAALVPMWLRVARDDPRVRGVALRYAAGVTLVQVLWVGRLWVHGRSSPSRYSPSVRWRSRISPRQAAVSRPPGTSSTSSSASSFSPSSCSAR